MYDWSPLPSRYRVTNQNEPDGRPLSVNVTLVRGTRVKVMATPTLCPFTVTNPALGTAVYPGAGGVYVHGGVPASFSVAFHHAPGDHLVLFEELMYWFEGLYGLPNGTTWSVSLGGTVENTTGMFLLFAVPNGTYAYTVTGPAGYGSLPASGRLTVNSTNPYEFYSPGAYVMVLFAPTTSLVSRAPAPAGSIPSAPESGQMAFLALRSEDPSRTT